MSHFGRIVGTFALLLALTSGIANAAQRQNQPQYPLLTKDQFPGLDVIDVGGDVGAPPEFHPADYVDYNATKTGPATWCGTVVLHRSDGQRYPLREVNIIPRTPYTVWYINKWLETINGRETPMMEPQYMAGIGDLPWAAMLTATIPPDSPAQIVRAALTDANGSFCIRDVPLGDYIYYGVADQTTVITHRTETLDPDSPDSEHPTMIVDYRDTVRTFGNRYVICGGVRLKSGTWYLQRADVCTTFWDDK